MRSGIQAQVLALYRTVLRAARAKDAATRADVQGYARTELEK